MDNQQRVIELFHKYLDLTVTYKEKQEFLNYVDDPANAELIQLLISEVYEHQEEPAGLSESGKSRVLGHILNDTKRPEISAKVIRLWPRIAAAASVIILFSVAGYFFLHKPNASQVPARFVQNDVAPGREQATLTLANGKKITLKAGLTGKLATQNQTTIHASQNHIIYKAGDQFAGPEVFNTLSTAVGEQSPYPLELADGTKVWLNAASSITFPVAFHGDERLVKITGEAYFEVVHNQNQPFRVQTAMQTVEDIGTRFDINSYADEPFVKTTLVEGAALVKNNNGQKNSNNSVRLDAGQQAQLKDDQFRVQAVNTARATAWKDGNFRFQNEDIQTIMRQLSRWYNIEVRYQGNPPTERFSGRISRRSPISAVLHMMELTNHIHFKIEGRRVTVMQ
jgi:hypothetical protein